MYSSLTLELASAVMAARTSDATTAHAADRPTRLLTARRHRRRAQLVAHQVRLQQLAIQ